MARKRLAILTAAREAFLRSGYEGTSMETVANMAGLSIMTLYRHAQSKEELFSAVIANACDPSEKAEKIERTAAMPLEACFVFLGMVTQQKLADPETVALLRVVMSEATRFPPLADTAYRGLVGHLEEMVEETLSGRPEACRLTPATRQSLSAGFVNRLMGTDMLRILLGLSGSSPSQQEDRAKDAARDLVASLQSDSGQVLDGDPAATP